MRLRNTIISAGVALLFFSAFAQEPSPLRPAPARPRQATVQGDTVAKPRGERTIVNIKSKRMFPIQIGGDSTVHAFVGNVVAYHNGAVMLCDSAVRYDENRIECFENVLINKDSTYVYGDRVLYDRLTNTAQVFSPLIKMIDGQAVLYTYHFKYNTLDNVGEYYGGGTMSQGRMLLESDRGYYYGSTRDAVCVGNVELRDSTYLIVSDSLGFNMDTEIATFYRKTYIWNEKEEILSANSGWYDTRTDHYHFMSDAYVLSEDQEIWADDMDYRADSDDVVLRRNIQILDEGQKVLAFGDYGRYWGMRGDAMLTEDPSVISFYEQGDSLYMRSDSIFMYVIDSTSIYSADYIGNKVEEKPVDTGEELITGASTEQPLSVSDEAEDMASSEEEATEGRDGLAGGDVLPDEEIARDGEVPETGVSEEVSATEAGTDGTARSAEQDALTGTAEAGISETDGGAMVTETVVAASAEETVSEEQVPTRQQLRRERREARRKAREERRAARRKAAAADERPAETTDGETAAETGTEELDAETADEDVATVEDGEETDDTLDGEAVPEGDTGGEATAEEEKERVIVGYHHVKIFRSDLQAVCDSLVSFSRDTTIHLHKDPVMWNGDNQIKSDRTVVYIKDEVIDHAVFTGGEEHGNPVMSAELDADHYNQITGKTIEALFRDNEIYRTNVVGNAQTYYYMQDEETGAYQGFLVMECADITFIISGQEIEEIIFRGDPVYAIYPMNLIPEAQPQRLPNFVWEGDRRPTKREVFDRRIKASRRVEYEAIPQPRFPLTESIDEYRLRIIEDGLWRDRDDDITYNAREYVKRLRMQGQ